MTDTMKSNLVIVRAGKNSLHSRWLNMPYASRNFDVIISYFDEDAYNAHIEEVGITAFYYKGGKWNGLYNTIKGFDGLLESYKFFWLPDDDIDCSSSDVNKIFENMIKHDIKIGQPSLTHNSYFSHFLLFQCPDFKLRYSNFIEVMVPCLRYDILEKILPQFEKTMSGFGLDYVWCRLKGAGEYSSAIFDDIAVYHTRPVGNVLQSAMKVNGRHPKDEERALCAYYGVEMKTTPIAYSGILKNNKKIFGKKSMGFGMIYSYAKFMITQPRDNRQFGYSKLIQLIRRQHTRPLDLSTVIDP